MPEQEIIAEVRDYESLLDAFRTRIKQLDVTADSVEAVAGLTRGYLGKVLKRREIPDLTRIRPFTMGIMLGALGVKLVLVEDEKQLELIRSRLKRRSKCGYPHIGDVRRPTPPASAQREPVAPMGSV
jgi:hypothetical protein